MENARRTPARMASYRNVRAIGAKARKRFPRFPWLLVLSISIFFPTIVSGRPAAIGPEEQLYQQFDVAARSPASSWKVSYRVDNDDCVNPSLGCFYFQQQPDSSWSLYSAMSMDVSSQHPDAACHLPTPHDAGSYRLFALNTTKTCVLRVMFRANQ